MRIGTLSEVRAPFARSFVRDNVRSFANTVASWYDTGAPGRFVPTYRDWATSGALFQDAAGTMPVTALEQFVGLNLDRSRNLIRGDERVPDPGFDNPAAWNFSGSTPGWVVSGGQASVTAAAAGNRWIACGPRLTVGRTYEVFFDLTVTSGGCLPDFSATPSFATTSGRKRWVLTATAATLQIIANPAFIGLIDNITVKEIPGAHRVQPTSTSRPILTARKNLFQKTETFTDAAWVKRAGGTGTAGIVTPNYAAAPDGTMTAARLQMALNGGTTSTDLSGLSQTVSGLTTGQTYSAIAWVKAASAGEIGKKILQRGVSAGSYQVITLDGTWQGLPWTEVAAGGAITQDTWMLRGAQGGASDTADVLIWHPQMVLGTVQGRYQRVNTATDYDDVGFPVGLRYDGIDDCMYTAAPIDYSGTDKVTVARSFRKDSDAATGTLYEHGPNSATTDGTFGMLAPHNAAQATVSPIARGTSAGQFLGALTAPASAVAVHAVDIAGTPKQTLDVNGVQSTNATTLGTGNLSSQVNYEGARANASFRFNGVVYDELQIGNLRTADEMAYVKAQFAKNLSEALA